jgi:hypothetical protein
MGEGRDVGGELGGVVIDPRARGQLPRHEARPPRRAEGRGGVGVGEAGGAFGQRLEVRRVQPVGGTVGEKRAVQLVDHQDQDVARSKMIEIRVGTEDVFATSPAANPTCGALRFR